MSVPNESPVNTYTGNGTTTKFPVTFQFETQNTLVLKVNGSVAPISDYYWTSDSSFNFYTAPASGTVIEISRNTPKERDNDYDDNYNTFRPKTLNKDFDRIWRVIQEYLIKIDKNAEGLAQEIFDRIQADADMLDYIMNQDNAIKQDYIQRDESLKNDYTEKYDFLNQDYISRDAALKNYIDQMIALVTGDPTFNGIDAQFVKDESGLSQQEVNNNQSQTNRNLVSIVDIDRSINPDGVANTSEKIQAIVDADESSTIKKKSYLYFPMLTEQYKLESPIRFTRPISNIFGFRAPTYDNDSHNRGGWLLVANSECGFDLGNTRTVTGTTDSWNLQGLAFKPFSEDFQHVADGVRFTTATNGPDRGVTLQQVTARKLNNGFYLKPSANYMIGTLIIEKCNFSTNKIGVNLDVKSEGVRIVGNQIEQCVDGAIRLKGAGGIVISDNMLEGQRDTIKIDATSNGQGSRVEISRNYFEANVGEYLVSFRDTSYGKGSLLIRDNQIADLGKYVSGVIEDTDFCRIYNNIYGYGYTIENHESYAVTFMDDATILPDSNLFGRLTTYFKQRDFNGNFGAKVYSRDFMRFAEDATYSALDAAGRVLQSPIGDCVSPSAGAEFFSVANYNAGDIVSVNILFKTNFSLTNEGSVSLQVLNTAKTATIITMASAAISQEINKQYTLGTFLFKVPSNETTLYFKLTNGSEPLLIDMYAGCVKNFGAATLPLKVSPVLPVRTKRYHFSGAVTGFEVAANSQQQQTYTVTGARLGDYVSVAYSANTGGVVLSGFVSAANTVIIVYRNNTSSPISLPSGTVKIRTSNC